MNSLPSEILEKILLYNNPDEICNFLQEYDISDKFIDDEPFWKLHLSKKYLLDTDLLKIMAEFSTLKRWSYYLYDLILKCNKKGAFLSKASVDVIILIKVKLNKKYPNFDLDFYIDQYFLTKEIYFIIDMWPLVNTWEEDDNMIEKSHEKNISEIVFDVLNAYNKNILPFTMNNKYSTLLPNLQYPEIPCWYKHFNIDTNIYMNDILSYVLNKTPIITIKGIYYVNYDGDRLYNFTDNTEKLLNMRDIDVYFEKYMAPIFKQSEYVKIFMYVQ